MAHLDVSDDELEATLEFGPDECLGEAEARQMLEARGVCHGLLAEALASLDTLAGPARLTLARGQAATPGVDASLDYRFRAGRQAIVPVIGADGRADYRNLGLVVSVQPGEVLARLTPATPGREARSVLDRPIRTATPRALRLEAGEGVALSDDGLTAFATTTGNPALDRRKLVVRREYVVAGDVNLATGNIDFDGDLTIRGHIQGQMDVRATGSVQIQGGMEGGRVFAGGNVSIAGGVRQQAVIDAADDVTARFLENSAVRCGGSLGLQENLINGLVEAGRDVLVGGSVGGGRVQLAERLEATVLGTRFGTATSIVIVPPDAEPSPELLALREERASLQGNLAKIAPRVRQAHEALQAPDRDGPDPAVFRQVVELASRLGERDAELAAQEVRLASAEVPTRPRPQLAVRELIHPGVTVQLGIAHLRVQDAYPAGTLVEERGQVRLLPVG